MNKGNLTITVWAVALIIFVALYIFAIKQEKDAKSAIKENKQAKAELSALQNEYLSRTSLANYKQANAPLSNPKEVIYIKPGELTQPQNNNAKKEHNYKLNITGL